MIEIHVPIIPLAKQADRQCIRKGKSGRQWIHHYQPKDVTQNAESFEMFAASKRPDKPLKGPLKVTIVAVWPWLKSHSKRFKSATSQWKETKPDCENISKQVCDCLQRLSFFANDSQIAELVVRKCWSDQGGIMVWIEELEVAL